MEEYEVIPTDYADKEDEDLWSTEVWLKNMLYYLKTERMMYRGLL